MTTRAETTTVLRLGGWTAYLSGAVAAIGHRHGGGRCGAPHGHAGLDELDHPTGDFLAMTLGGDDEYLCDTSPGAPRGRHR